MENIHFKLCHNQIMSFGYIINQVKKWRGYHCQHYSQTQNISFMYIMSIIKSQKLMYKTSWS